MTPITDWTVDYQDGRGPKGVTVPHAWRQEMAVSAEGPAVYASVIEIPKDGGWLLFHSVSYAAVVLIDGAEIGFHEGLWDAFSMPLHAWAGKTVALEVKVTKNGGPSYPVQSVASGFLPYVFHTFGGIYGPVELHHGSADPLALSPASGSPRIAVENAKLYLDGSPFYMRGLLHWGWYPELGHTAAPLDLIEREIKSAKALGFNTVKFCLWVPPHRYLEALDAEGMVAWLELPVWNPTPDEATRRRLAVELEAIVRQYRRHSNIIAWTIGCEMGNAAPASFRQRMTSLVRSLTGSPLVRDDSGGAEMYGGDPREYGTFYDYHPYCDLPFYPAVIDSLLPGARASQPFLLGEFNDYDAHRDLARLLEDHPYWASALPEFNELGVRWQYDLPLVLRDSRFAHEPRAADHEALLRASVSKGAYIRRQVADVVRSREAVNGYVITGWRDTPISSAGMFDDWGRARYSQAATLEWNGSASLFLLPQRRPTWQSGGNRPGYLDTANVWVGPCLWKFGVHTDRELHGGGLWRVSRAGHIVAEGVIEPTTVEPLRPTEVGSVFVELPEADMYTLHLEYGPLRREWQVRVVAPQRAAGVLAVTEAVRPQAENTIGIDVVTLDGFDWEGEEPAVVVVTDGGTHPAPFWRECAFQYRDGELWEKLLMRDVWDRFLPISGDRTLDFDWIKSKSGIEPEPLMMRIDTRTYAEAAILARIGNQRYATTLRPFGGLGCQPPDLTHNPSGALLLYDLLRCE
ncbi:MAG: glycoside hydrolase family 2 protein [Fimbriimonadaceae bacterium]